MKKIGNINGKQIVDLSEGSVPGLVGGGIGNEDLKKIFLKQIF